MAKKHKHEEHENHERWVISYADLMTLLFALFVVMYASSRVDTSKLAKTSESMRWALHFKGEGGATKLKVFRAQPAEGGCMTGVGAEAAGPSSAQKKAIEETRKKLEKALKPFLLRNVKNPGVKIEVENGKLRIRLAAHGFFDPASASLRPEALAVLDAISTEVAESPQLIRVEGHTDDGAITSARYRNNWDLSAARAATVVSYLEQAHTVSPARLSAAGMGSSHPLVSNDTPESREMNRRIELVLEVAPQDPRAYLPPPP